MKKKILCGQCGQPFVARPCGPTHALIAAELREGPYARARLQRLKGRLARIVHALPPYQRRLVNEAIDAWAVAERHRGV